MKKASKELTLSFTYGGSEHLAILSADGDRLQVDNRYYPVPTLPCDVRVDLGGKIAMIRCGTGKLQVIVDGNIISDRKNMPQIYPIALAALGAMIFTAKIKSALMLSIGFTTIGFAALYLAGQKRAGSVLLWILSALFSLLTVLAAILGRLYL